MYSDTPRRSEWRTDPEQIIQRVRKSVRAIVDLDSVHQAQGNIPVHLPWMHDDANSQAVICAYEAALKWTFVSAILFFLVVNILVIPLKIPRLGYEKVAADTEDEN